MISTVIFFVLAPIAFLPYGFNHLKMQYGSHNWFFVVTFVLAVALVIEGLMWLYVYAGTKID